METEIQTIKGKRFVARANPNGGFDLLPETRYVPVLSEIGQGIEYGLTVIGIAARRIGATLGSFADISIEKNQANVQRVVDRIDAKLGAKNPNRQSGDYGRLPAGVTIGAKR